jgi:general secretion pathway protein C
MFVQILKKYVWIINLCLLTGLAYFAALIVNHKLESIISSPGAAASQKFNLSDIKSKPTMITKHPTSYYKIIITRNIFGITNPSYSGHNGAGEEALPDTSLNLVLLGTILNANAPSVAIIKNPDNNKVSGYRSGDVISIIDSENIKLLEVMSCKAVIERQDIGRETIKCRDLGEEAPSSSKSRSTNNKYVSRGIRSRGGAESLDNDGITKVGDNEYEVSRETLEKVLSDPTQIIQQARVIPQSDGLRFFGIRSNSIFWKIGIKNGDTLHSVNNVELNNVEKALNVFEELRSQSSFTIDFTRAGKDYTYEYTVR